MAQIKFGFPQINMPTPAGINRAARVITITLGIFLGWMSTNNIIPAATQNIISSILGLVLALVNGLAPMFGVQVQTGVVATKDVTAIETAEVKMDDLKFTNASGPKDMEQQSKKKGL